MRVKLFLVYDVDPETGADQQMVAARLSMSSAREIAKAKGNRRVERRVATKDPMLIDEQAVLDQMAKR